MKPFPIPLPPIKLKKDSALTFIMPTTQSDTDEPGLRDGLQALEIVSSISFYDIFALRPLFLYKLLSNHSISKSGVTLSASDLS
jgi:hypothetical protein